jgi:hypothetical protein
MNRFIIMDESQSSRDIVYEFYIVAYVKTFKGQRSQTSEHLSPDYKMRCDGVDDFRLKLWNNYNEHVRGIAVIPANLEDWCSIEVESNVFINIEKKLSSKKVVHPYIYQILSRHILFKHFQN